MPDDLPEQYVPMADWSAADHLKHQADASYRPESPAYTAARDEALTQAGFEPEVKPLDFDSMSREQIADLTPEQHFERIARPR